jgi:hypothetical protein
MDLSCQLVEHARPERAGEAREALSRQGSPKRREAHGFARRNSRAAGLEG